MYLAIDVGATKTLLAAFSSDAKINKKHKFKTPQDYNSFITELRQHIVNFCEQEKPVSCALAMPGKVDRERGTVIAFGNKDWTNVPVRNDLHDVLDCPVYLENDANLAGLAEASSLDGKYRKVLYVTISTGIGGGYVVDGELDPEMLDAEIGQTLHEYKNRLTRWEDFASGSAIVKQVGKMAKDITDESDWYMVARNIAIGLINVIATLTPDCIVMGGGVGSYLEKFHQKLHDELEMYSNDLIKLPEIRKAQHPEEAVIYGGYLLCKQHAKS